MLAVAYVLSRLAGPGGFFLLGAVAAFLLARHGPGVAGGAAAVAALACPLGCAAFRRWFRRWGQRHWPEAEPGNEADGGG
jgi:hypothetical protein